MPRYDLGFEPSRAAGAQFRFNPITPATPNQAPNIDTARWAALAPTAWSATEGFAINAQVTDGGNLFQAVGVVPAITAGSPSYTQVFDFAAGGSTATTQSVAHYVGNAGFAGSFNAAVCVNTAHDSLLVAGGNYRLRRASGTAAEMAGVTGALTKQTAPYGGANYVCFRIGTAADMTAAFGTAETTSGASWILESVGAATVVATADWRATPIAASGTARYNHTGRHLAVSTLANSGAFPSNLTGTWRLQQAGTNRMVTGALTIVNPASGGVMDIRVGSAADMAAGFGNVAITSGGNFELVKTANAAPAIDTARWSQLVATAWNNTAGYNTNAIATFGSPLAYYRATTNIPAVVSNDDYRLQYAIPPLNAAPENASSQWASYAAPTAWSGSAGYAADVLVSSGGNIYRSLQAIPAGGSANSAPNVDTARWAALSVTAWSGLSAYAQNSYVVSGGQLYRATQTINAPQSNSAPNDDTARWIFVPIFQWSASAAYNSGTIVLYNNALYRTTKAIGSPVNLTAAPNSNITATGAVAAHSLTTNNDDTILFVVDGSTFQPRARAYNISTGASASSFDISLTHGKSYVGAVKNGNRLYFVNNTDNRAECFNATTRARQSNLDISLGSGTWGSAVVSGGRLFFVNSTNNSAAAYNAVTYARDASNDLSLGAGTWLASVAFSGKVYFYEGAADVFRCYNGTTFAREENNDLAGYAGITGATATSTTAYFLNFQNVVALAYTFSAGANTNPQSDTGNWTSVASSLWSATAAYAQHDLVIYQDNVYRAIATISAPVNNNAPASDTARWAAQNSSPWSATAGYPNNAIVTSGGNYYRATTTIAAPVMNAAPPLDVGRWSQVNATAWSGSAGYAGGAFVLRNGTYYRATVGAGNSPPPASPWSVLTASAWSGTAAYQANALVNRNGALYRANNSIAAPSGGTGVTRTWNAGSAATSGQAQFFGSSSQLLVANRTPATGAAFVSNSAMMSYLNGLTGNVTLSRSGGGLADGSVTGVVNGVFTSSGGVAFRVGTQNQMAAAFGTNSISSGSAVWTLTAGVSPTPNTAPESDATNWTLVSTSAWSGEAAYQQNAIVSYNSAFYQASAAITVPPNAIPQVTRNPSPPNSSWGVLPTQSAWSATAAYAKGATVLRNNVVYRARNAIAAPTTSYAPYATWNNFNSGATPNNSSGTSGGADYYAGSGTTGNYRASLFVNVTPLTTGAGYTAISGNTAPAGNYRLRFDGTGNAGVPNSVVGTIDIRQPDNAGRRAIIVSPDTGESARSQDMIDAFGSTTPGAGGVWHLERQVAGANTAPESDTTNWEAIPAWNATAGYEVGDVARVGSVYYTATMQIVGVGDLAWLRPANVVTGAWVLGYDTDTEELIWRELT